MLNNHFKIAIRTLVRQKTFSLLNIFGLAIAICVFLVIALYVADECTFDAFHKDADSIFRIVTVGQQDGETYCQCPQAVAELCLQAPQVENAVRFQKKLGLVIKTKNDLYLQQNAAYTDPSFFDIFSLALLHGDRNHVLQAPDQILLSTQTALTYFGQTDIVGETVVAEEKQWIIAGVYEDIPQNSHLPQLDVLLPYSAKRTTAGNDWTPTYVKLINKNQKGNFTAWMTEHVFETGKETYPYIHQLQPIKSIHLGPDFIGETSKIGNRNQLIIFASIAVLILCIACLNFINLSMAQSLSRFKEIGIRKVIGALRSHLFKQFLTETFIIIFISFMAAILLSKLSLPWFNLFAGKALSLSIIHPLAGAIALLTLFSMLLIICLSPLLRFTIINPVSILKGMQPMRVSPKINLRSIFVVFQFIISIALIVCSLTILQQMHYVSSTELGFHQDHMLVIPTQTQKMAQHLQSDFEAIKQKFTQHHNVQSATAHLASPGRVWRMDWPTCVETNFSPQFPFTWEFIDFDFINTYELEIVHGRNFSQNYSADFGKTFILNQAAAQALGFNVPEQAIGKHISTWMGEAEIVGILKDFHYQSLHQKIEPLMLSTSPGFFPEAITLKLGSSDMSETLTFLQTQWKEIFPNHPFEYYFVDEDFALNYQADDQFAQSIYLFAGLAIFVACLGLFGIAALSAAKRTKEIGVRKVLGSSVTGITVMLCRDFSKWILMANLIAWPIAWYAMHKWLQNFAYKIELTIWPFLLAGLVALAIALLTISWQTIRAATANPVEALRYE